MRADPSVIAVRQLLNDVVNPGFLRCSYHQLGIWLFVHLGDVLRDGSVEQNDVLRQITDVTAQLVRSIVIELSAIEAHFADTGVIRPTIARASVVLPELLWPITLRASPGEACSFIYFRMGSSPRRTMTLMLLTASFASGRGSSNGGSRSGIPARNVRSRLRSDRAACTSYQLARLCSTG